MCALYEHVHCVHNISKYREEIKGKERGGGDSGAAEISITLFPRSTIRCLFAAYSIQYLWFYSLSLWIGIVDAYCRSKISFFVCAGVEHGTYYVLVYLHHLPCTCVKMHFQKYTNVQLDFFFLWFQGQDRPVVGTWRHWSLWSFRNSNVRPSLLYVDIHVTVV